MALLGLGNTKESLYYMAQAEESQLQHRHERKIIHDFTQLCSLPDHACIRVDFLFNSKGPCQSYSGTDRQAIAEVPWVS